jgi:hypothetical protein
LKVVCRIRPTWQEEALDGHTTVVEALQHDECGFFDARQRPAAWRSFAFDRVLAAGCGQVRALGALRFALSLSLSPSSQMPARLRD